MMGRTPFAGVAWQGVHYLEAFRRLGHHVYYVEDTGAWPYDPEQNTITDDCSYTVNYIGRLMDRCGMRGRWAYRSATGGGQTLGLSEPQVSKVFQEADALINLTGATLLGAEHLRVPVRIYLETDPVLPQIEVALGRKFTIDLLSAHTHHFTYGENLGAADCRVPLSRYEYYPTRQPIVLDCGNSRGRAPRPSSSRSTPVASWEQTGKDVVWDGETYTWSKHLEFLKFIDLPRQWRPTFELALACDDAMAMRLLSSKGWRIVDALGMSKDILPYRDYILNSRGEFTVAKDQNIRLRSGWFSDRSACYLAAAKPVITQDTGFGQILPTGRGLFAFRNMDEILAALDRIESDYEGNCRAAHEIALEYFEAENVAGRMLEQVGLQ